MSLIYKFHQHKSLVSINDIDINKVVVSNKQNVEKYQYVVSNDEIEIYFDEENSNNYDEENFEKIYSDDFCNEDFDEKSLMILMILVIKF